MLIRITHTHTHAHTHRSTVLTLKGVGVKGFAGDKLRKILLTFSVS